MSSVSIPELDTAVRAFYEGQGDVVSAILRGISKHLLFT